MTPATVRLKEDGRYELISGHRRKKACEFAGLETLKCEVKELTRDEAIIVMVESNLQRTTILPSEKAFAYKMRLEAMDRQGQRVDLTSTPVVSKSRSNEELADKVGESREQIRRYIRLTELVPEILLMVDERRIAVGLRTLYIIQCKRSTAEAHWCYKKEVIIYGSRTSAREKRLFLHGFKLSRHYGEKKNQMVSDRAARQRQQKESGKNADGNKADF